MNFTSFFWLCSTDRTECQRAEWLLPTGVHPQAEQAAARLQGEARHAQFVPRLRLASRDAVLEVAPQPGPGLRRRPVQHPL